VVRGEVEPATFRFQAWRSPTSAGVLPVDMVPDVRPWVPWTADVAVSAAVTSAQFIRRIASRAHTQRLTMTWCG